MRHGAMRGAGWDVRESARDRDALGGSFLIDARGTIVGFDGAMERLTGWSAAEVVGRGGASPVLVDAPALHDARPETVDLTLRCHDGSLVEIEAALQPDESSTETATVTVLRVIARGEEGRSLPVPGRDALTGLAGREAFFERLASEIRAAAGGGRTLAVLVADVDHLRRVTDLHGAEAAATALRKLAGVLRATVRDQDLVARLEEDDFAVILPGLGRGSARQIAARIRSIVERSKFSPGGLGEAAIGVTLSIGAASYPTDADNETDLLARAREALDEARALGRNRVWCYTRRPRVPLRTPVYLDGATPLLLGYSRDLSPSGLFVSTPSPIGVGMRCALSFPLPNADGKVHVIGRVVRTVPIAEAGSEPRLPGMGVEFERFGPEDRRAIESYLFVNESQSLRPEKGSGTFSVGKGA